MSGSAPFASFSSVFLKAAWAETKGRGQAVWCQAGQGHREGRPDSSGGSSDTHVDGSPTAHCCKSQMSTTAWLRKKIGKNLNVNHQWGSG